MCSLSIFILVIGLFSFTKKIIDIVVSIKQHNKEKIKVDVLFLVLVILLTVGLLLYVLSRPDKTLHFKKLILVLLYSGIS